MGFGRLDVILNGCVEDVDSDLTARGALGM